MDADLLLVVIDGADAEWAAHLETTRTVLSQVQAEGVPQLLLVNKTDKMSAHELEEVRTSLPEAMFVTSQSDEDVREVRERLVEFFERQFEDGAFNIPFADAALRAEIWDQGRVLSERYDEQGCHLVVRAPQHLISRWQAQLRRRAETLD